MCIYQLAVNSGKTYTTLPEQEASIESNTPDQGGNAERPNRARGPDVKKEDIEVPENPIYIESKTIKKIKPIFSYDHIKKSLELEVIDKR